MPCLWTLWSDWSACTSLCSGHQERSRAISQFASHGGPPCHGGERVVRACNTESASCVASRPKDCVLSEWKDWSTCSHDCGGGQTSRTRAVAEHAVNFGKPCVGTLYQTEGCNTEPCPGKMPVDCEWGLWGGWSACSSSCGGGQHSRYRSIDTEPANGGRSCEARSAMETQACNTGSCFGTFQVCGWDTWEDWAMCSKSCGGGQQERGRQKAWVPANSSSRSSRRLQWALSQDRCIGSQKATQPCGVEPCAGAVVEVLCEWSHWTAWGPCTCQGLRERQREVAVHPQNSDPCVGPTRQTDSCTPAQACAANVEDCEMSSWSLWSECTRTCGGGQRFHSRSISKHGQGHGLGCQGSLETVAPCNTQSCAAALDCMYADWSQWGVCSRTCEGGQRERSRRIDRFAANGGKPCQPAGLDETEACNTHTCDASQAPRVDCTWALWSEWSACSASCGNGLSSRSRGVTMEAVNGGRPCDGVFKQVRNCTSSSCLASAVDCKWADWSSWTPCSDGCHGHRSRARAVEVPATHGGILCAGAAEEMRSCTVGDEGCVVDESQDVDCLLSPWAEWSACSQPCSGGQRDTSRSVMRHAVGVGKPCSGTLRMTSPCNTDPCPGDEPVDCAWEDWGAFGACSATCAGGQYSRTRKIRADAERGGRPCNTSAASTEIGKCNVEPCSKPRYCSWGLWSDWGECSVTCDGGEQRRHRSLVKVMSNSTNTAPLQMLSQQLHLPFTSTRLAVGLSHVSGFEWAFFSVLLLVSLSGLASGSTRRNQEAAYAAVATDDAWSLSRQDEETPLISTHYLPT